MAGETEEKPSGWTVDTLHMLVRGLLSERTERFDSQLAAIRDLMRESDTRYEQRFIAQQEAIQAALLAQKEAVQAALIAADRAVAKAETASEKRFEGVNEFRGQLADQAAQLMPRSEAEARIQAMADKLSEVVDRVNRSEGRGTGMQASWAIAVAVFGMLLGVAGLLFAALR